MSILPIILSASGAASLSFAGCAVWAVRRRRVRAEARPAPTVSSRPPLCEEPAPDRSARCELELGHYGWHRSDERSWWRACWLEDVEPAVSQPAPPAVAQADDAQPAPKPEPKPKATPKSKPKKAAKPYPQLELEFDFDRAGGRLSAEEAQCRATAFAQRWKNTQSPYVMPSGYPPFLAQENWNRRFRRGSSKAT